MTTFRKKWTGPRRRLFAVIEREVRSRWPSAQLQLIGELPLWQIVVGTAEKAERFSSTTYMGVFFSPVVLAEEAASPASSPNPQPTRTRRMFRRVDIKL
jgi:hypothetical protein